jgi:hypothetical protein
MKSCASASTSLGGLVCRAVALVSSVGFLVLGFDDGFRDGFRVRFGRFLFGFGLFSMRLIPGRLWLRDGE